MYIVPQSLKHKQNDSFHMILAQFFYAPYWTLMSKSNTIFLEQTSCHTRIIVRRHDHESKFFHPLLPCIKLNDFHRKQSRILLTSLHELCMYYLPHVVLFKVIHTNRNGHFVCYCSPQTKSTPIRISPHK